VASAACGSQLSAAQAGETRARVSATSAVDTTPVALTLAA